jgi:phytol kinase
MGRLNFKRELARKFVHLLSVLILVIYYFASDFFSVKIALMILVFILMIFLEFEYFRIETGNKIPILGEIWKYMRRDKEKGKVGGDVFFIVGSILVLAIFDLKIAMVAMLMTTFGDMAAALIGKKYGKHWLKHLKERAWEGILAEFFVDVFVGIMVFFWGFWNNPALFYNWHLWIVIGIMSLTATIVETLIYKMDDNLIIPVFSGFNGQVALLILNYFG